MKLAVRSRSSSSSNDSSSGSNGSNGSRSNQSPENLKIRKSEMPCFHFSLLSNCWVVLEGSLTQISLRLKKGKVNGGWY